ncbi:MAG: Crp/Fnr family transcriptional regulator [Bacteroidota bacterium]
MNPILQHIENSLPGIDSEVLKLVGTSFVRKERKQGDVLLRQGEVCRNMFFLTEGISRSYSIQDGNDITTWLGFKNQFLTSFTSFFLKESSYESIEMLTDGILFQMDNHQFEKMRMKSIEIEKIINHFIVHYSIQLEKRLFTLQTLTSTEHYKLILEQEPHLVQHIPNKHLASYLGITRETLSRIRSSIN